MTFIIQFCHKDTTSRYYSYPVKIGKLWDAKRLFGCWRFVVYWGKIKLSNEYPEKKD